MSDSLVQPLARAQLHKEATAKRTMSASPESRPRWPHTDAQTPKTLLDAHFSRVDVCARAGQARCCPGTRRMVTCTSGENPGLPNTPVCAQSAFCAAARRSTSPYALAAGISRRGESAGNPQFGAIRQYTSTVVSTPAVKNLVFHTINPPRPLQQSILPSGPGPHSTIDQLAPSPSSPSRSRARLCSTWLP